MKAKIDTKRVLKLAGFSLVIFVATTVSYAQGLLVEGTIKAFNSLKYKSSEQGDLFKNVYYSPDTENAYSLVQESYSTPKVINSFKVSNVEVNYEKELIAEDWMLESFSENLESNEIEDWMTEPFNQSIETPVVVENWMTSSFDSSLEPEVEVEDWMTKTLYKQSETLEDDIVVEDWMTEPFN